MSDDNLRELLRIGKDYLRRLNAGRFTDDALSHWTLRLANHKEWPHTVALDYWRIYGCKAMIWSLRTVMLYEKARLRAESQHERPLNEDEGEEEKGLDSRLPRYHEALEHCTPLQQEALERVRGGEELKGRDYANYWKGLRNIRKALGTDAEYSKQDRRRK